MRVDDVTSLRNEVAELTRKLRDSALATPISNTSVGRGRLRLYDSSELLIEDGNFKLSGTGSVDGTLTVTGTQTGSGTFTWTGTSNLNGPTFVRDDLSVVSGGQIKIGNITIAPGGTYSGSVTSTGTLYQQAPIIRLTASTVIQLDSSVTVAGGLTVTGAKMFGMPHPTREGWWIQHASTESPLSGTEYWGEGKFDSAGKCVVTLPSYFDALNKPSGRRVYITAIGQPFVVGADRPVGNKFTAYGVAGREFSWLVKAERFGGDFETESLVEVP